MVVVPLPFVGVAQHGVCRGELLEQLCGLLLLAVISIRVILQSELLVLLLDLYGMVQQQQQVTTNYVVCMDAMRW